MSRLLPYRPPVEPPDGDPTVIGLGDRDADEAFAVLSSTTARSILARLYERPATQSDLADDIGTSLQNVDYHLHNLEDAGLVEVVGEWYSEKGTAMNVYAPSGDPLVLMAGDAADAAVVRDAASAPRAPEAVEDPAAPDPRRLAD